MVVPADDQKKIHVPVHIQSGNLFDQMTQNISFIGRAGRNQYTQSFMRHRFDAAVFLAQRHVGEPERKSR